jgi:hypothetical protein
VTVWWEEKSTSVEVAGTSDPTPIGGSASMCSYCSVTSNTEVLAEPRVGFIHLQINNPMIAWLAYRGLLSSVDAVDSSFLSVWQVATLTSAVSESPVFFDREMALERARAKNNPGAVSRLRGLYIFPTREEAERAAFEWDGFRSAFLAPVRVRAGSTLSTYDADWISNWAADGGADSARRYAVGEPRSVTPHWEHLVSGEVELHSIELREQAYEVVKAWWPDSLGLLELGRLAAEIDLPLGYIAAFPLGDPPAGEVRVRFMMNLADAQNPALLAYMESLPPERVNGTDLHRQPWLLPDLRAREFSVPISHWIWSSPR